MSSLVVVNHYAVRGKGEKMAGFGTSPLQTTFLTFAMLGYSFREGHLSTTLAYQKFLIEIGVVEKKGCDRFLSLGRG
jgi:hypothetical protein